MMNESIKKIEKHLTEASKVLLSSADLAPQISEIVDVAVKCLDSGGTIFWCGNGGSAADSQHLAAELIGRYKMERKAISSIALTTDSSILTAISNDFGFEQVFSRQLEGLARSGDVLIALSTSGTSKSILNAIEKAKGGFRNDDFHQIFRRSRRSRAEGCIYGNRTNSAWPHSNRTHYLRTN